MIVILIVLSRINLALPNMAYGHTLSCAGSPQLIQVKVYFTMTGFEVNIQKSPKLEKIIIKKEKMSKCRRMCFFWGVMFFPPLKLRFTSASVTQLHDMTKITAILLQINQ